MSLENPKITPRVSVVVITYNQENYIRRTIDSILDQKCSFPFEIVIGDDCSTDSTSSICADYAQRFPGIIRHHRNENNLGIQANYFDSILRCKGDFIADCGGDDYWIDPFKLQKQFNIINDNPEIALVHTGWNYYDESTDQTTPYQPRPIHCNTIIDGNKIFEAMIRGEGIIVHSCTMLFRKSMFMECYHEDPYFFRDPEFRCEDVQVFVSLAHKGKFAYIPTHTLNYSVGKPSVSFNSDDKTSAFYFGIIKLWYRIGEKYSLSEPDVHQIFLRYAKYSLGLAFLAHNKNLFNQIYKYLISAGTQLPMKTKLKKALTHFGPVWTLSAFLIKKKLHSKPKQPY